ncbi:MAG: hypothetical protein DPW20_02220 [Candidatus Brocadia sp.]|uniref:Peptidase M43 pregnancy-associated plasma-A domain-containing protein n=1 Tax=Candidatus Brocadia sinica JPN1 TaxID=1197129 RepID=A0ABQ0JXA2_9BACT|nr:MULTISPECIES: M43 family zinc metalloprotease [Brocadia]MBL1168120.1 hypothetical protein [Candidatus Brocadia sp. AMX1]MCQ3916195.1 hypothetical protein [Candidatus Brocadia sp.]NOG40893.1 hypothetical protein [Planctomycetota bacterium]GIK13138.1 MAG: hypothetical protein BroJett002_18450 [Candidatus Brocadia sinica]RIJ93566.1 MAG: hypothetical protein DB853_00650 [Candidatus Brocadia sp.]
MKRPTLILGMAFFSLFAIPLLAYSPGIYAQEKKRICATMEVHEKLLKTIPAYRDSRAAIENLTRSYLLREVLRAEIVKIPVVVHVVYNTPEQNISDDQIKSQIRVLNEDYRKLNADVSTVPSVFQPLATDSKIEFAFACKDPEGKLTSGITRTKTDVASFTYDDAVKFTAKGGRDAWPRDKYLNIWVCNLGGGLLGYAQFPGGPADTDGVVITYTAFGDTGTAVPPFNKGRTATHEVGHWLNLFHIWGDDCPGGDQCGGSDSVGDTPNQECSNYGCPAFPHISCSNGPNGDLFMNYMDYTDDACMVMFTNGQSARMDAALAGPRLAIQSSDGLICPDDVKAKFRYEIKFICGKSDGKVVAPGLYWTAINVGNPTDKNVILKKRFSIALPGEKPGPVSDLFKAKLGPYQAFEIDNRDIFEHTRTNADFIKGFVVIESEVELEVIAVYTAAGKNEQVETLDVEHVLPRCLGMKGCPDLVVEKIERPEWDAQNKRSVIRATIKNIGDAPAGSTVARLTDTSSAWEPITTADAPTPALGPGDTATVTFFLPYWVYNPDADLEVKADYKNELSECSEDNNVKEFHELG